MNDVASLDSYGVLTEPATLRMERLLPGPIERVWSYLTDSELRRRWFAAGVMELRAGAPFEFVWRNDELTDPPGQRPAGFGGEHRMQTHVIAVDPPRTLVIAFGGAGQVSFTLRPEGDKVRLTLVHSRLPDRATMLKVGPGWHAHLDLLVARVSDRTSKPFWDEISRLREDYERRLPA